jgi:hypothetical protein
MSDKESGRPRFPPAVDELDSEKPIETIAIAIDQGPGCL